MRNTGYSLLHMAARKVREDLVNHLLDRGAEREGVDLDGYTAVHVAAEVHTAAAFRHLPDKRAALS